MPLYDSCWPIQKQTIRLHDGQLNTLNVYHCTHISIKLCCFSEFTMTGIFYKINQLYVDFFY